ncbi:MAG TPA: NUDIX hydrolase [Acidimicrobiaceae bacterium]|jgi:8-oxo-dGTP pyrophosphatase MutT (NUDIX family)|nr:NUDIX hydrolase [Acidimicrobiaceae bacterium]
MQVVMDGKTADGPAPEMVDIVDHCDRVVATVSRAEMRAHRLQHRAVSIAVVGTDGRFLVHRRADHKDLWPGMWDLAAGGVVAAGETYEAAARRELAEELGVQCAVFEYLGEGRFADESVALIGRGYLVVHDGPFAFTDGEIAEVRWVTRAELGALMTRERFVPDNVALLLPLLDAR